MNKIETTRLTLRNWTESDADKNWGMTDEGRLVTMRYLANDK